MHFFYILLTFLVGMLLAAQPAINATVGNATGHPLNGALISVVITFLLLLAATLLVRGTVPSLHAVASLPNWTYLGGAIGAIFLFVSLLVIPKIGAATAITTLIAGQLIAALLLDHFGAFGLAERAITPIRIFGVLLLAAGVYIVRRY